MLPGLYCVICGGNRPEKILPTRLSGIRCPNAPVPANDGHTKINPCRRYDAVGHVGNFGAGHLPHGFNYFSLKPYFDHGGKLIQYHGWSDPQISPGNSLTYYQSVVDRLGPATDSSYRLFMVPGMGHCAGGEGTDSFDAVKALETWVEEKGAPGSIPAARIRNGKVERTRPLCPFPQLAIYKGGGSTDEQANFACKALP